jgi:hypothetical protein
MLKGTRPFSGPITISLLPSRHRNKVDRFINRRGITGLLVGFGDPIRAPLGRF